MTPGLLRLVRSPLSLFSLSHILSLSCSLSSSQSVSPSLQQTSFSPVLFSHSLSFFFYSPFKMAHANCLNSERTKESVTVTQLVAASRVNVVVRLVGVALLAVFVSFHIFFFSSLLLSSLFSSSLGRIPSRCPFFPFSTLSRSLFVSLPLTHFHSFCQPA